MARSVSVPSGALAVEYADACDVDADDWGYHLEALRDLAAERYPSLSACNEWLGREDRAVLENAHCYITVSEYCGLVAVAIVPKEGNLAERWCSQVDLAPLVEAFGPRLISKGRFSNGEQAFFRADLSRRETVTSNGSRF